MIIKDLKGLSQAAQNTLKCTHFNVEFRKFSSGNSPTPSFWIGATALLPTTYCHCLAPLSTPTVCPHSETSVFSSVVKLLERKYSNELPWSTPCVISARLTLIFDFLSPRHKHVVFTEKNYVGREYIIYVYIFSDVGMFCLEYPVK